MGIEGSPEPVPGRVRPIERGVQLADALGVRAHETDQRPVDRATVGDRHQIVEEPLAQRMISDGDGCLDELADEDGPQVRPLGTPVRK